MNRDDLVETPRQRCRRVLLDYLLGAGVPRWPGSDSLTIHEVLLSYPAAANTDAVPGEVELIRRHPDLAAEVRELFAGRWRSPA